MSKHLPCVKSKMAPEYVVLAQVVQFFADECYCEEGAMIEEAEDVDDNFLWELAPIHLVLLLSNNLSSETKVSLRSTIVSIRLS